MKSVNIPQFISEHITFRKESFFSNDLKTYDQDLFREINGKSVLVIGGAGTIGSHFIKALLNYHPVGLVVVDINENELTELTRVLRSDNEIFVPDKYLTYPVSFGDPLFKKIFKQHGPFDIIANFAAHKHVRSEKDIYSIEAMIRNNVINTRNLLELLKNNPPKHYFSVSTDKAANPVNIMGASKKLMEDVLLSYAPLFPISTARFANVAFSNGSLLYGYTQRVAKHQPFSCPSDVKRFFVSPIESGQLCLIACVLGKAGEIFFPKLNDEQMMNFKDITLDYIKEIGAEPDICTTEEEAKQKAVQLYKKTISKYPVYFFDSNTSGEKLYEEFFTKDEIVDFNKYAALGTIKRNGEFSVEKINKAISDFEILFNSNNIKKTDIVALLSKYVDNFHHIETGINLDSKM